MHQLSIGDTVGIVSPGFGVDSSAISEIERFFHEKGFGVKIFGANDCKFGRFAASDEIRAKNLMDAFKDSEVRAIICARGGYGAIRILEFLDYEVIAANAKLFVGYSDVTALLNTICARSNLVTFHGPMGVDYITKQNKQSIDDLFATLMGDKTHYEFGKNEFTPFKTGFASGILTGGNITTLQSLVGVEGAIHDNTDKILVLEDVGEFLYKIDRMIFHLKSVGYFKNVQGIIFSNLMLKDEGEDNSLGMNFKKFIDYHFSEFSGPIALDMPCGHSRRQITLPFGCSANLEVSTNSCSLNFSKLWSFQSSDSPSHLKSISADSAYSSAQFH